MPIIILRSFVQLAWVSVSATVSLCEALHLIGDQYCSAVCVVHVDVTRGEPAHLSALLEHT